MSLGIELPYESDWRRNQKRTNPKNTRLSRGYSFGTIARAGFTRVRLAVLFGMTRASFARAILFKVLF